MKKAPAIIVGLCLLLGVLLFLNRSSDSRKEAVSNLKDFSEPVSEENNRKSSAHPTAKPSHAAQKGDASAALAIKGPVVHTAQDFPSGDMQNLKIVDGSLQLSDDPKFKPRLMPYNHFGIHISPEIQADEPFETILPALSLTKGQNSELTFEIRTKTPSGVWSTWQELPNDSTEPFRIELPSISWQYRATFYANDTTQGPKLSSVSVTTKRSEISPNPEATFSANNRP